MATKTTKPKAGAKKAPAAKRAAAKPAAVKKPSASKAASSKKQPVINVNVESNLSNGLIIVWTVLMVVFLIVVIRAYGI